jgi:hypothetical protein
MIGNNPMVPAVLPTVQMDKAQTWILNCSFWNQDQGLTAELSKAYAEVPLLKEMPQPTSVNYSKKLADELREFMRSRMIWTAGEWHGRLSWSVEGKPFQQMFQFALSNEDIYRMSAIAKYFEAGFGVYLDLRYSQVLEANPSTIITLQPVAAPPNARTR